MIRSSLVVVAMSFVAWCGSVRQCSGVAILRADGFSIADRFIDHEGTVGTPGEGSHIHASNELPVDPDNSTVIAEDAAEVGGLFGDEEIRGLAEFDLTGMTAVESATLHFATADVSDLAGSPVGGLFGQPPYEGTIEVVAYPGNNMEDESDFQASVIELIGTFDATSLMAGDPISFDITELYNGQIDMQRSSLGVRLQVSDAVPIPEGATTFNDFQVLLVPEPSAMGLAAMGMMVLLSGAASRRWRRG